PGLIVAILGTTAPRVPQPEVLPIEWDEVGLMIQEGAMMLDGVTASRTMRSYASVCPLIYLGARAVGREMRRYYDNCHHEERHGARETALARVRPRVAPTGWPVAS